ncbi:MAG: S-adenosyl-l-methionine hydroxide adenosyltransferase family protein [Erysipelotrichaceae bacterium]|nr:S-adenosyl-l-methionine hydroxide adenosyltransferase family protein [Erysipelotrichaceae bacterium]
MNNFLVFQSDFGLADGAVSAMEGVSFGVSKDLNVRHLTHEIGRYNIFDASYRLFQTIKYWPEGTVFVSVVDPGVGSNRLSIVAKTVTGQYVVTPDNGTLTHVAEFVGLEEVRQIDETINRLKDSNASYTFHGRDVYAYTGARLASNTITYEQVGPVIDKDSIKRLRLFKTIFEDESVTGQIDILDVRYGSLWTSITIDEFKKLNIDYGELANIHIQCGEKESCDLNIVYGRSFADVSIGSPILYMNSVNHMAVAINQGSFAEAHKIGVGNPWTITIKRLTK